MGKREQETNEIFAFAFFLCRCYSKSMSYIKQYVEVGGISYPEYGNQDECEQEDRPVPTEIQTKLSNINNCIQSALFQIKGVQNPKNAIARKFLEAAEKELKCLKNQIEQTEF